MNGKMRVSIVATALDGHKTDSSTVLNMTSRIQNRNNGYSEGLFSQNTNNIENSTFNSIEGATAFKLDEKFEINEEEQESTIANLETTIPETKSDSNLNYTNMENDIPTGVSIENASYIEDNSKEEEYTPKLFSEANYTENKENSEESEEVNNEELFNQDFNEEEEFEIPAFLRKQKF